MNLLSLVSLSATEAHVMYHGVPKTSINALSEDLINLLQEDFSHTVHTLLRSVDKLETPGKAQPVLPMSKKDMERATAASKVTKTSDIAAPEITTCAASKTPGRKKPWKNDPAAPATAPEAPLLCPLCSGYLTTAELTEMTRLFADGSLNSLLAPPRATRSDSGCCSSSLAPPAAASLNEPSCAGADARCACKAGEMTLPAPSAASAAAFVPGALYGFLCYACKRLCVEGAQLGLAAEALREGLSRLSAGLRRRQMRLEIQDFLLDDDG
jgi:hypothetical protein